MPTTVLQFDPASLALWFGLPSSGDADVNGVMSLACNSAVLGDLDELRDLHREMVNHPNRDLRLENRVLGSVSSIWHESRHFIDMVLTNYGSFKTRRYAMMYANLATLVRELPGESGILHCPVVDYLDPVQRRLYGLAEPDEGVRSLLADIRQRSGMIREDRSTIPTMLGDVEMGGTGQMEVMAFICQSCGLQAVFGIEGAAQALSALPDSGSVVRDYMWVMGLQEIGLVQIRQHQMGEALQLNVVNSEPILALFLGTLATRHWGQQQVRTEGAGGTGFAAERLFGLAQSLGPKWRSEWPDAETAWQQVNEACQALWGRSALVEMAIDLDNQAEFAERLNSTSDSTDPVSRWYCDILQLRRQLVGMLHDDPGLFVSPERFPELMSVVRVPLISTYQNGVSELLSSHKPVLSYHHEPTGAKWSWASFLDFDAVTDRVGLTDGSAWGEIVSFHAPAAKLLLGGRLQQMIVGPEILVAEAMLEVRGVTLHYRPPFDLPPESPDPQLFWYFWEEETATCDWCRNSVPRGEGAELSPWLFRMMPPLGQLAIAHLSPNNDTNIGYERFLRDWSPWLVCNDCRDGLAEQVPRRLRRYLDEGR
jgi:hypothetical protein